MQLTQLTIQLQPTYASNAGKYIATIEYNHKNDSKTKLILEPEISEKLLEFCGPAIIAASKDFAEELNRNIQSSLLEMKGKHLELENNT